MHFGLNIVDFSLLVETIPGDYKQWVERLQLSCITEVEKPRDKIMFYFQSHL